MKCKTLQDAQDYLYQFCFSHLDGQSKEFQLQRAMRLAKLLGNPQNNIKVIHVAGTSGKGSTCAILSRLLQRQGFKVGLSVSPHLIDMRERMQIDNAFLSVDLFCLYLQEIVYVLEKASTSKKTRPTYFEVMIVLAYYIFWKEKVDYAVMETGMGGRLDATNVVTSSHKTAVFTRMGLDHTEFLGNTIEKITAEKAAIIHPHNLVVSIVQGSETDGIIRSRAQAHNTSVRLVIPNKAFAQIKLKQRASQFDFHYKDLALKNLNLSVTGLFQVENTSLALATLFELSKRDKFGIDQKAIRETLSTMTSPGRFETVLYKGKTIIIDGAHNPQKMSAFITSLKKIYPTRKFDFLIGFKKGKDYKTMVDYIVPYALKIYISAFAKQNKPRILHPESISDITDIIKQAPHKCPVSSYDDPQDALKVACEDTSEILVITGSLYLISALYPIIRGTL